jgi:hypothetical protein
MSDENSAKAGHAKAAGAHNTEPSNEFNAELSDEALEEVSGGTMLIAMSLDVCPGSPAQGWSS